MLFCGLRARLTAKNSQSRVAVWNSRGPGVPESALEEDSCGEGGLVGLGPRAQEETAGASGAEMVAFACGRGQAERRLVASSVCTRDAKPAHTLAPVTREAQSSPPLEVCDSEGAETAPSSRGRWPSRGRGLAHALDVILPSSGSCINYTIGRNTWSSVDACRTLYWATCHSALCSVAF